MQDLKAEVLKFLTELDSTCDTLQSSSKLLNFCVEDILAMARINSNKFRKNCSNIDTKMAINEVMSLQAQKANFNGLQLSAEFHGFPEDNFLICTDAYRLQQVVLNL